MEDSRAGEIRPLLETSILKAGIHSPAARCTSGHWRGQRTHTGVFLEEADLQLPICLSMETPPDLAWLPWRRQAPCTTPGSVQPWRLIGINTNPIILRITVQL